MTSPLRVGLALLASVLACRFLIGLLLPARPAVEVAAVPVSGAWITATALWYQDWLQGPRAQPTWSVLETVAREKSLVGEQCLVTGSNTGLGRGIARRLLALGCDVTLAVRRPSVELDNAVLEEAVALAKACPELAVDSVGQAHSMALDLANLSAVNAFVQHVSDLHPRGYSMLILNAGVSPPEGRVTADGFEQTFGVNCLGHAALTQRLLESDLVRPFR